MSYNIQHGYMLPLMNLVELNEFILSFKEKAEDKVKELGAKAIANLISHDLDEMVVFGKEEFIKRNLKRDGIIEAKAQEKFQYASSLLHAYMDMRDRYHEVQRTSSRDPVVDFDADAIFIPLEDRILVLFYTEQRELRELWESQEPVTAFGYWDSCDHPEDVTNEEWKLRKELWLTVWTETKQAGQLGMNVVFTKGVPERHEMGLDLILQNMSSLEQRAKYVARNKLFDDKFKELKMEQNDFMDVYYKVNRWLRTEEGKAEEQQQVELCKNIIIPEFKREHLTQSYQKTFMELSK